MSDFRHHLPLFDAASVVEAELGIAVATKKLERPDGPAWLASAVEAIRDVARHRELFTVDDVWTAMGGGDDVYRSQMGIAFRLAKRAGLIRMNGTYTESRRAPRHRSPVRVWRSLLGHNILNVGTRRVLDLSGQGGFVELLPLLGLALLLAGLGLVVVASRVPVWRDEGVSPYVHKRVSPNVRLPKNVYVFNAPDNRDEDGLSGELFQLFYRDGVNLILPDKLIPGLNKVRSILPLEFDWRLWHFRQKQRLIGASENLSDRSSPVSEFVGDVNFSARKLFKLPVLHGETRPFQFVRQNATTAVLRDLQRREDGQYGSKSNYGPVSDRSPLPRRVRILAASFCLWCISIWLVLRSRSQSTRITDLILIIGTAQFLSGLLLLLLTNDRRTWGWWL